MAYYIFKIISFDLIFCIALPSGTAHIRPLKNASIFKKRRPVLYFSDRFYRGGGTCSACFLHSYSFHLYAFIFIKGILLLFILYFNSLSRRGGKQPFRRLFGRIALFHFFLTFAMRLPTRSSPDTRIKKSCIGKCRCKIFGRGDGT